MHISIDRDKGPDQEDHAGGLGKHNVEHLGILFQLGSSPVLPNKPLPGHGRSTGAALNEDLMPEDLA